MTTKKSTNGSAGEVKIVRVFDAPRAAVWKAWTDPEELKRWWGPKAYTMPTCTIDLRVGGKFFFCMRSPEGKDLWAVGVYREVVHLEKFVVTDSFADEKGNVVPATHYGMSAEIPLEMLISVTLEDTNGKTRMTLRHTGLPAGPDSEGAVQGWSESFDKLAAALEADQSGTIGAARGFTVERTFKASPEKVWEMWTTKAGLERWYHREGWSTRVGELDVRVGGAYEITITDGKMEFRNHGTYTEVARPSRLAYTWLFDIFLGPGQKPYDVPITVEFREVPGGTKMTFTHGALATAESTEGSRQGLLATFDMLAKVLGE